MACLSTLKDIIREKGEQGFTCHTWGNEEIAWYYNELKDHSAGFYSLDGRLYEISFTSARNGMGGMDQGSPATARIVQIKKCISLDNA